MRRDTVTQPGPTLRTGATLSLRDTSARPWDALVVGAGPAGAVAAHELARRGAATLLVDKARFPRDKTCGCCVNESALATLASVGLGGLPARLGAAPLRAVRMVRRGRSALVALGGVALSRAALDAGLIDSAVARGVEFLPDTVAAVGPAVAEHRHVTLRRGEQTVEARARIVVAADGLAGRALRQEPPCAVAAGSRFGVSAVLGDGPAAFAPGVVTMACGASGYAGVVRLEDQRVNIAAALDPAWSRSLGGPGEAVAALLREAWLPSIPGLEHAHWMGTPALTRTRREPAGERLFIVGDAAGYVEPFTGEGIAWALAGGAAVAPIAERGVFRWESVLAAEWSRTHRALVRRRQWGCRAVAAVLRRPVLTSLMIALAGAWPGAARRVVASMHTPGIPPFEPALASVRGAL